MKTINNVGLLSFGDVENEVTFGPTLQEFIVSENKSISLSLLVMEGDINLRFRLTGSGSKCDINIVYLSNKNNKQNINIEVIHESQKTTSSQQIRGIVTGAAYTSFQGLIRIPPDSQKCIGTQHHRAVLLSEKAQVSATPELEIEADDVQCSHGSAIGMLDEAELFYLMSRGLPEKSARRLLLTALIRDILPPTFDTYVSDWMNAHV